MKSAGRAAVAQTLSAAALLAALSLASPAAYAQNSVTPPAAAPAAGTDPAPAAQPDANAPAAAAPVSAAQAAPAPAAETPAATAPPAAEANNAPPATPPAAGAAAAPAADGNAAAPAAAPAEATTPAAAPPADAAATPPAQAQAPAPPPAPADPIIAAVREKLSSEGFGGRAVADDRQGAVAFYQERSEGALWVKTGGGFTPAAEAAIHEIRKADEWGLSAAAFTLPQASTDTSPQALAETEAALTLNVLQYARHARGGRINPEALSPAFDLTPTLKDPKTVLAEIAKASAADAYLRDLHPKHEQFKRLKDALAKLRGPTEPPVVEDEALSVKLPMGKNIKPGANHPDVALLRRRLKVAAEAGNETIYDERLQEAVMAFQRDKGLKANGLIGKQTRLALNGDETSKPNPDRDVQRVVNNMERWRWMPENLGDFYVWNNVPEFKTRTIKDGKQIYEERIVVGLPQWVTPSFSAQMKTIVFHPEWGVPDGIKQKELAPQLRRSTGGGDFFEALFGGPGSGSSSSAVLRRHDLRVSYNGRPVDPDSVNWSSVDIRRFQFTQPSGPKNVLGIVKFLFPNKHDVYMHDTTAKELFKQNMRAYSHGCMRVANPIKFAELLLQEDKGWAPGEVEDRLARGSLSEVKLDKTIWVHNTYFTAVVDDSGKLNAIADVYGFEPRVAAALSGKQMRFETPPEIAEVDPDGDGVTPQQQRRRKQRVTQSDPLTEAITGLFAN